jgi:hypothetical protein
MQPPTVAVVVLVVVLLPTQRRHLAVLLDIALSTAYCTVLYCTVSETPRLRCIAREEDAISVPCLAARNCPPLPPALSLSYRRAQKLNLLLYSRALAGVSGNRKVRLYRLGKPWPRRDVWELGVRMDVLSTRLPAYLDPWETFPPPSCRDAEEADFLYPGVTMSYADWRLYISTNYR